MKIIFIALCACVLLNGCAKEPTKTSRETGVNTQKMELGNEDRKVNRAMMFMEQAEEDADVHNVIVIPPDEKVKESKPAREESK